MKEIADAIQKDIEAQRVEDDEDPSGVRNLNEDKKNVDSASAVDQLSKELGAHHIWTKTAVASTNVRTDWSCCNMPNSVGWQLCPPRLRDALVVPGAIFRMILEEAAEMTYM
jgi:hypothetical protein